MDMKLVLSGRLSVLPCCIQREADGITDLLIAVFAVKLKNDVLPIASFLVLAIYLVPWLTTYAPILVPSNITLKRFQ
jgi:hypothetical protein